MLMLTYIYASPILVLSSQCYYITMAWIEGGEIKLNYPNTHAII